MLVAMGLAAALCVLIGIVPRTLYAALPYAVDYVPYTAHHVVSTLGLLAFTALGFFLLLRQLDPEPTISLDTDWFYRKGAPAFLRLVAAPVAWLDTSIVARLHELIVRGGVLGVARALAVVDREAVDGSVHSLGSATLRLADVLKLAHTGKAHHYAMLMAAGTLVLIAIGVFLL
jgi:multicomponent Na+:H+ antiporter subunit D